MNDYKINCVGMTDEQKRLVQDAFFKLGFKYEYPISEYHYGCYYFAYAYRARCLTYVGCEDIRCFEQKNHTEVAFNELMKLANMEEYMTFTKADLRDGMVVKYRGGCEVSNKYGGLSLVVGESLVQAHQFDDLVHLNRDLTSNCYPEFDIVEVFEVVRSATCLDRINYWQLKSIWKRPAQTPQQKALADLEAKQQELIDQAEKIKADIAKLKGM